MTGVDTTGPDTITRQQVASLSEDPLGFAGSGPNLYEYAYDSPLNFRDPLGLDVTVTLWPGDANGAGHVGVGVNTGDTQGWYPIQKYWWCISGIAQCQATSWMIRLNIPAKLRKASPFTRHRSRIKRC